MMTTASQIDLQFFRCGEDSRKVGLQPASTFWRSTAVHSENFSTGRHLCKRLVESFFRRICPGSALLRFGDGLVLLECSTTPTTSPQEQKGVRSDRIRESPTNERQEKLPFLKALSTAQYEVIPGAGHAGAVQSPEFVKVIRAFLEQHQG